ncbi:hypothetical protein E4P41_18985 [Geodermatophilus sp. DF01-2]|uniref:CG0192-related protein n=1 Tax=Geodermatophilus sp. DF01-2 TaxID=2559610 RepID=UPI0010730B4A|nr:hypothetical protein [Geodermatophilus sp. DF01_2]TFV54408.1 hypothetical protein E4P41_18985 [Geodermatophilus sp. DF01_2]
MAIIHRADLRPTKLELVGGWVPTRPWGGAAAGAGLQQVAAYRFDDPEGEVGVETFVVRAGDGSLRQVPLTYRGAPAPGQEAYLVGTMEHSVLGRRWVYDACGDPVYVAALAGALLAGSPQAEEFVEVDGTPERREPSARVTGSGSAGEVGPLESPVVTDSADATTVCAGDLELVVRRVLDLTATATGAMLTGTWAGQPEPVLLATARCAQ